MGKITVKDGLTTFPDGSKQEGVVFTSFQKTGRLSSRDVVVKFLKDRKLVDSGRQCFYQDEKTGRDLYILCKGGKELKAREVNQLIEELIEELEK